MMNNLHFAA